MQARMVTNLGVVERGAVVAAPCEAARASAASLWSVLWATSQSHGPLLTRVSLLAAVSVLCAGMGFLVTTWVANILGRAAFGQLALAVSLGTCGGVIVRFSMDRTLVRDLIHFSADAGRHIAASIVIRGGMFLALCAGLLAWQVLLPQHALSWEVAVIAAAISLASLDMQGAYDAAGRTNRHAIYLLIQKVVYLAPVAMIVFIAPQSMSLGFIAMSMAGAMVVGLALQMPWVLHQTQWRQAGFIVRTSVATARSNAWIWLSAVACLSFGTVTQIILEGTCGSAELGGYAAAWQLVSVVTLVLYQVGRVGNAMVSRITIQGTRREDQLAALGKYCAIMFVTSAILALPLIVAPVTVLSWFFSGEYASSGPVLRLMGAYEIVFALAIVASQFLVCARMVKTYFVSVVSCGAAGLALCYVLASTWGPMGAAASLLISHGLAIIIHFAVVARRLRAGT